MFNEDVIYPLMIIVCAVIACCLIVNKLGNGNAGEVQEIGIHYQSKEPIVVTNINAFILKDGLWKYYSNMETIPGKFWDDLDGKLLKHREQLEISGQKMVVFDKEKLESLGK